MKYFEKLDSTNDYVKTHYEELDNFEVVFASNQTKGKGRGEHTWEVEPNKNATFSICIKDDKIIKKYNLISIVTGLLICNFLDMLGIAGVAIKWPNDVYVNGKKIAGILLEGSLPNYLVIGIGINVNQANFPGLSATSIKNEIGTEIDQKLIATDISDALKEELKYLGDDLSEHIDDYIEYDYLANKTISFTYNDEVLTGIASGINLDGSLKVKVEDKVYNVNSNEVTLLK